jgi:Xaa-Pro aminopeptidase
MGIGWNEPPYLNLNLPEVTIEKNMCFAYHAGFVVDGVAGVFIENTYAVTDTGFEILTKWPYEKIMVCGTPRMV